MKHVIISETGNYAKQHWCWPKQKVNKLFFLQDKVWFLTIPFWLLVNSLTIPWHWSNSWQFQIFHRSKKWSASKRLTAKHFPRLFLLCTCVKRKTFGKGGGVRARQSCILFFPLSYCQSGGHLEDRQTQGYYTRRETHTGTNTHRQRQTQGHTDRQRQRDRQTDIRTASFLSSSWDMISSSLYSGMTEPRLLILACSSAIAFSASTRRYSCGNTCQQPAE